MRSSTTTTAAAVYRAIIVRERGREREREKRKCTRPDRWPRENDGAMRPPHRDARVLLLRTVRATRALCASVGHVSRETTLGVCRRGACSRGGSEFTSENDDGSGGGGGDDGGGDGRVLSCAST